MFAADNGHRSICEILLKAGADPTAKNNFAEGALDAAKANGREDIVQLLIAFTKQKK